MKSVIKVFIYNLIIIKMAIKVWDLITVEMGDNITIWGETLFSGEKVDVEVKRYWNPKKWELYLSWASPQVWEAFNDMSNPFFIVEVKVWNSNSYNLKTRLIIDFNNLIVSWLNPDSYESSILYNSVVREFNTRIVEPYQLQIWEEKKEWSKLLEWTKEKTYALNFTKDIIKNYEKEYLPYIYSVVRYLQKIVNQELIKWNKEFNLYNITKEKQVKEHITELYYKVKTINQIYEKIWDIANYNNLLRIDILISEVDNNTSELVNELIWFIDDKRKEDNTKWDFKSDIVIFSDKIKFVKKVNVYKISKKNKSKNLSIIYRLLEKRVPWFENDIILTHSYKWEYIKILETIDYNLEAGIFSDFIDQTEWVMSPHYVRSANKMYDYIVSIFKKNGKEKFTRVENFQNAVRKHIWFIYILYRLYDSMYLIYFIEEIVKKYNEKVLSYSDLNKIVQEVYKEHIWWNKINVKKLFEEKWFYLPSEKSDIDLRSIQIKWNITDKKDKIYKTNNIKISKKSLWDLSGQI